MIALVDRLQERVEMRGGPRSRRCRDQDDRLLARFETLFQGLVPALRVGPDDERLGLSFPGFQEVEQPLTDRVRVCAPLTRHHDHEDRSVGNRVAERRCVERMNPVVSLLGRRAFERREGLHATVAGADNHISTASL